MVEKTRELELSLGDGIKRVEKNETNTVIVQRRAIRVTRDLPVGHVIVSENLKFLRPCPKDAFSPYENGDLIGKKLDHVILEDQAFKKCHAETLILMPAYNERSKYWKHPLKNSKFNTCLGDK